MSQSPPRVVADDRRVFPQQTFTPVPFQDFQDLNKLSKRWKIENSKNSKHLKTYIYWLLDRAYWTTPTTTF